MADFQTGVLDNIAKVVGGSQPDATNRPRWFSGDQVGDGSGLQAVFGPSFKGCYSAPPESIPDVPVGVVVPGAFQVRGPEQGDTYVTGFEYNIDDLRLFILLGRVDAETDYANMAQYRDLVPAAFAGHISAFSTANIIQAMVRDGKPVTTNWAGVEYSGIEFTIRVIRAITRVYAL